MTYVGLSQSVATPGEWITEALCTETDPELFFPEKGGSTHAAKAVCKECPVRKECLEYALRNRVLGGIWGGYSTRERLRLLTQRGTAA